MAFTDAGKIKRTLESMVVVESAEEAEYQAHEEKEDVLDNYKELLKCTKCFTDFYSQVKTGQTLSLHPILNVLFCESCLGFYVNGDFSVDEDEEEKYCRWCGEGGTLLLCSKCICGFCPKCIKKNLGSQQLKDVKDDDNWNCFLCEPKPLWHLRHVTQLAVQHAKAVKEERRDSRKRNFQQLTDKHLADGDAPQRKKKRVGKSANRNSSSEQDQDTRVVKNGKAKRKSRVNSDTGEESSFTPQTGDTTDTSANTDAVATCSAKGRSNSSDSAVSSANTLNGSVKSNSTLNPAKSCNLNGTSPANGKKSGKDKRERELQRLLLVTSECGDAIAGRVQRTLNNLTAGSMEAAQRKVGKLCGTVKPLLDQLQAKLQVLMESPSPATL